MDSFYIIVACVAIVLLILLLTVIGLMMKNQNRIDVYPPNQSQCPDYWLVNNDGKCVANIQNSNNNVINALPLNYNPTNSLERALLKNIKVTGSVNSSLQFDFSGNTICENKAWANGRSIQWDGISNAVTC